MTTHHFRVIQGNPCPEQIAPFIELVLQGGQVNSIYRGDDARSILNAHGKSSQEQLYQAWLHDPAHNNPANRPGTSTHELKSDGVAYPHIPIGHDLEWWMQGFDVNDNEVVDVEHQAVLRGWRLFRPYPAGSEFHHLNFTQAPGPSPRHSKVIISERRIEEVRNHLPRR